MKPMNSAINSALTNSIYPLDVHESHSGPASTHSTDVGGAQGEL
jgi:hypothetical protein